MRVAIIGSRTLTVDISKYIPKEMTEIISGGATGIDKLAEQYASTHKIPRLILRPDYAQYGNRAPIERNKTIVELSDMVIAIWDRQSHGTKFTINYAKKRGKKLEIYIIGDEQLTLGLVQQ